MAPRLTAAGEARSDQPGLSSIADVQATDALDALREIVGGSNVLEGNDAAPALIDWRQKFHGNALAVVRPGTTAEVSRVVRCCIDHDLIIVTQGGNTGLSGGQQPTGPRPAIVLSLRRMDAIESVDADNWSMTVQGGVTIEAMQDAAGLANRKFAPDWGARGTATIGGAIATDAGGINVLRYGNMRDQVMGLEVVLADGQIWEGLRSLRKDSSGYDMKHMFIGSEGTLGIITRAVVNLHPATTYEQTALVALRGLDDLMALFALARQVAPDEVTAFELMPEVGVAKVCEVFDLTHPMESTRADFYALIKLAGTRPVLDSMTEILEAGVDAELVADAVLASTADQVDRLWKIRDELPPTGLYPHQKLALKMDTAVPMAKMGEYHDIVRAIAGELVPGAIAYGFGHVGDGNLHMMVLPETDDQVQQFLDAKDELVRRIDEATFALGGTLSAEHGVGRELIERVAGQKPDVEWAMMHSVKLALDPDDRFNPGALLPQG